MDDKEPPASCNKKSYSPMCCNDITDVSHLLSNLEIENII